MIVEFLLFCPFIIRAQTGTESKGMISTLEEENLTISLGLTHNKVDSHMVVNERILGNLRQPYIKTSFTLSGDGNHFAYICGSEGQQQMIADNIAGEKVVFCSAPQFSPTSNQLHYVSIENGGYSTYKVNLVVGDKKVPADFIPGSGSILFSNDGGHYSAIGNKGGDGNNKMVPSGMIVIIDDKVIGTYKDATQPIFTSDGKKNAFFTLNTDETMSLIVNSTVQQTFKKPTSPCSFIYGWMDSMVKLLFISDNQLSYFVRDDQGWSIYKDEQRIASYGTVIWGGFGGNVMYLSYDGHEKDSAIMETSLVTDKNGTVIAWWSRGNKSLNEWRILVNGVPIDDHVWISDDQRLPPKLSSDGSEIAYVATSKTISGSKECYVIHGNKKYGPYNRVWALEISDDGKSVAYSAKPTEDSEFWNCYVNGSKFGEDFKSLYNTIFFSNNNKVAWAAAREGKAFAVIDGIPCSIADAVLYGPTLGVSSMPTWILRRGNDIIEVKGVQP